MNIDISVDDGESPMKTGLLKEKIAVVEVGNKFQLKKLPESVSFDKGLFIVFKATQLLRRVNHDAVTIVAIAGASGSGKTFFASKLGTLLGEVTVLSLDNYMKREDVVDDNFDDPRLVDFELLSKNLEELKAGKPTEMPIYSFAESRRVGYKQIQAANTGIIVMEGIHALNSRVRDQIDISVSISGGVHNDLIKRILRDISRVGQTGSEVLNQVSETVYPMYKAFIEPDLSYAQVMVQNQFNPFDGFLAPTYILKSSKQVSTTVIKEIFGQASKESDDTYNDIYLHPPGTNAELTNNWIRVREQGKKYNLMFSEWLQEGDFIISPRISFEVGVKVLSGLMALGYQIGCVLRRVSKELKFTNLTITLDQLAGESFIQIKGQSREDVAKAGSQLGLVGSYDPRSYIEMIKDNMQQVSDANEMEEILKKMGQVNFCSLSQTSIGSARKLFQTSPRTGNIVTDLQRELREERASRKALEDKLRKLDEVVASQAKIQEQLDKLTALLSAKQ